jgi:hypothetical protein
MKRLRCCHFAALLAEDNSAPGCSRYEKPHGQNKEEGRKVWRSPSVCVLTLKTVDYSEMKATRGFCTTGLSRHRDCPREMEILSASRLLDSQPALPTSPSSFTFFPSSLLSNTGCFRDSNETISLLRRYNPRPYIGSHRQLHSRPSWLASS